MSVFDEVIDRHGSSSIKWEKYSGTKIIPMWIADMDFMTPKPVIDALHKRVEHGVFGYTRTPEKLYDLIISRLEEKYDWSVKKEWILFQSGLVNGINSVVRTFTGHEGEVMVPVPAYPPFLSAPSNSGKTLKPVPLSEKYGRTSLDFPAIEKAISDKTSVFLLCNPHNPCGTMFTRRELEQLSALCIEHEIVVCSDEIHADIILDENKKHIPIASLSRSSLQNTITLMAPSKTFNIPGLRASYAIIPNERLRNAYNLANKGITSDINCLGFEATMAAYEKCGEWESELILYLRRNRDFLTERINRLPGFHIHFIEATFLAWADIRQAGIENPLTFFENAGVGVSCGDEFGADGFVRINYACPYPVLKEAVSRIEMAAENLGKFK